MFGDYGGMYVPPVLEEKLKTLAAFFEETKSKTRF